MLVRVSCVILLTSVLLQVESSSDEDAWRVYHQLKSTIANATLQGLQRLKDLHEDNILPSLKKVVEAVESDMTDTYLYKQSKIEQIGKTARDGGVNIIQCLHDYQEKWLQVWQEQMETADEVSIQATQQVTQIVTQAKKSIRNSFSTIFDDGAALTNCTLSPSNQDTCISAVVANMKIYIKEAPSAIDDLLEGVENVMVPVFTYMYAALISVSTNQAIEGKYIVSNVTECANKKSDVL